MTDPGPPDSREWKVGDHVFDAQGVPAVIAYVGEPAFATGKWVGLIFDHACGKNNGTVKDVKYFECKENHGRFVKENQVFATFDNDRRGSSATSLSGSTTSLHSIADSTKGDTTIPVTKKLARPSLGGIKPPSSLPPPGKGTAGAPRPSLGTSGLAKPGTSSGRPSIAPVQAKPKLGSVTESKLIPAKPVTETLIKPQLAPVSEFKVPDQKAPAAAGEGSQERPAPIPLSEPFRSPDKPKPADVTGAQVKAGGGEQVDDEAFPERRDSLKSEGDSVAATAVPPMKIQESAEHAKLRRDQEVEITKLRLHVEQLELNKAAISDSNRTLQKELDTVRRALQDAQDVGDSADEVAELRDSVEMLAIDKEMAEEQRDQLKAEVDDLRMKLEETTVELESLQHEVKAGGHGEASSNFRVNELQSLLEKSKEGLRILHGRLAEEKMSTQKLEKDFKTLTERNEDLTKKVDKLQAEREQTNEVLADLREQVDAALGSEEMVERLIEQKLDLEDRLRDAREEVDHYDEISSTNNEIIELNNQEIRQLREEGDMARSEVGQLKLRIQDLQQNLTDSTVTIHKFRDHTRQLQKENAGLREQLQQASASSSATAEAAPAAPVTIDFRLKLLDEKAIAERVSHRMLDIHGKMLEKKLGYVTLFMPDLYAANREEAFVQICVIPEQIGLKLGLIGEEIAQKFDLPAVVTPQTMEKLPVKRQDEVTYGLAFAFLLKVVELWDRDIDHAIRFASPDAFSVLNELEGQLQRQDESIQYYVDLLRQSRLDEVTSLEYLETSAAQLMAMVARLAALGCEQRTRMEKLKDVMDVFTAGARVVSAVSSGLKAGLKESGPEMTKWLVDFIRKSDEILDIARKIRRPLDTDNELRAVMLPDHVQSQLRTLVEGIQRVATLCFTWYRAVGHQSSLQVAEKGSLDGNSVKALLNAENDRGNFYKSVAASPQLSMLTALEEELGVLRQFSKEIEDGQWTRGASKAPEMPKHPLRLRAEMLKKSLADAEDLKSKIVAKDEEILEIRKNLRAKLEEVSELQLRRNLTEKKRDTASKTEDEKNFRLVSQNKELTDRLTKLQNDYDSESSHLRSQVELLESEKRQMEEKLKQTSKRFLSVDMSPGKPTGKTSSGAVGAGDQYVDGQVDVLRQVVASLRAEIVAVKCEQVRRDLEEKLPPLRPPATAKRDATAERVGKLRRQERALEMERVVMLAKTALDLTKPEEEREKLMRERKNFDAEFHLKMRKIQTEISELTGPGRNFFQDIVAAGQ
ncbi:Dynactin subunit 1 [Hypsibius exemplaris]|uniref:Dynactin subunit 1 n=1 Tax=Hypsibius exemplaris TaxID=2072580 RepID=A0A1W0WWP2_HYPEX|nr:Dynactin subunit 1 [Hypsibius exemplaris]